MGLNSWKAEAPSNIALIKYMGKAEVQGNRPANASLSYTLDHLVSFVEISESSKDAWAPLVGEDYSPIQLSEKSQDRFLAHFQFLKSEFQIPGHYLIRSANNFPSDCGLASSASSFAALTKAAYSLALDLSENRSEVDSCSVEDLSVLSRKGSGSSCRSFFRPWALWKSEGAEEVLLPFTHLHHQVVILEKEKKLVSSSEAHKRVLSSQLFEGRVVRAESRLQELLSAFMSQDWRQIFELTWAEFWDMHALFETSQPSFGYMSANSLKALEVIRNCWRETGDGPIATMDAGANVHLLYRPDQSDLAQRLLGQFNNFSEVINSPGIEGGH